MVTAAACIFCTVLFWHHPGNVETNTIRVNTTTLVTVKPKPSTIPTSTTSAESILISSCSFYPCSDKTENSEQALKGNYPAHQEPGVHADCNGRRIKSFPRSWPGHVVWLDLSGNDVTKLGQDDLDQPELRGLRRLDLSHNKLKGQLKEGTFVTLPELRELILNHNHLDGLDPDSMKGLNQLTVLDLSFNWLQLDYDTYPSDVFRPLVSLQELYLLGNDRPVEGCYPDKIFLPLSNLTALSIDAFPYCDFDGPGFHALVKLRYLKIQDDDWDSSLKLLKNTTLRAFRNASLEELVLGTSYLRRVETCAFCELPRLKILRANWSKVMSVERLLAALYGLQHQNMTRIDLSDNHYQDSVIVDWDVLQYVHNICVKHFSLRNTNIQLIKHRAIFPGHSTPFLDCLEDIDLSKNRITGDGMTMLFTLQMKSLKVLQLQKQSIFSLETAGCFLGQDRSCYYITHRNNYGNVTYTISPQLQFLNLSAAINRLGSPQEYTIFRNASGLKTVDISYARLSNCITTILGLTALETLDMSGNHCYNISKTIFDFLPTLRRLRLSNFDLNPQFFRSHGRRLFKNLRQLESVDLSLNRLVDIDPFTFSAQPKLKRVNLAGNRLQSLPVELSATPTLEELDLSRNMLATLLHHERQELDTVASRRNFTLRLRGNPLLCACSNLDFLQWLWRARVRLDGDGGGGNYTCVLDTGEVTDTATVIRHYNDHWRRCIGPRVLTAALAGFLLQLLAVLATFIISRSWTHIIYTIKVMRHLRLPKRHQFRRDVYVGYADADWRLACVTLPRCLQQRHGVRLLLRDREELPGSVRAETIVDHIDDSWKVLLLVTRAFAEDEWLCGFTVQQAERSITDTLPDRVLVLFLDDPSHLPPMASLDKLLRMVPERNVLHVQRGVSPSDPVWDRLARDILGDEHYRI